MISGEVSNIDVLDRIDAQIAGAAMKAEAKALQFVVLAQSLITQSLEESLGSKAKHFDVTFIPLGRVYVVKVSAVDDIGNFIYNGTTAHEITASSGSAIPIGNGRYAHSVSHPGTEGMQQKVASAVLKGLGAALVASGGVR